MEWQVATRRRGKKAGNAPLRGVGHCVGHCHETQLPGASTQDLDVSTNSSEIASNADRIASRVREHAASLKASAFARAAENSIRDAWSSAHKECCEVSSTESALLGSGQLLCLGIGSVELSVASGFQLALAWVLAESLGITERSWADPQMRPVDRLVGEALGFTVADPRTAPDTPAGSRPLFLYMPHCDRALYERVLGANLDRFSGIEGTPDQELQRSSLLSRVVLIGNSFKIYTERDELAPQGAPGTESALGMASLIQRLRPCTVEQPLGDFDQHPEAFNDLSVITFPADALQACLMSSQQGEDVVEKADAKGSSGQSEEVENIQSS